MVLFNPATPIVRAALDSSNRGLNGPWQETIDLIRDYMWACFVALGGGEMVMVSADLLRPVDCLKDECGTLIRQAANWSEKGAGLVNPTAARFALIRAYRLLLHFGFVEQPQYVEETVLIDLESVVLQ